MLAYNKES